ncbi:MAG: NAD(+) synthase [Planctomycetes bacterium SCN 63-9]|nr:MAG: NAD(+) synthase [Planctomycetes bacterium SCN 63-9]
MNIHGFVRITTATLKVAVADPAANAREILGVLDQITDSDIVVFPELCVTGYSCGDLFGQAALLDAANAAIGTIARATAGRKQLVVVGAPLAVGNGLYNTAVAIADGRVLGIVPKQFLPTYKEFYEGRWFQQATGAERAEIDLGGVGRNIPFGIDLLFEAAEGAVVVGIEICEDLWVPIPPSAQQAMAGVLILLNPSASNETIGKNRYRTDLVVGQSGRCVAAYAYAGAGPTESTTDVVFGGHCLIAENGRLLESSPRIGDGRHPVRRDSYWITADVDVELLARDRRAINTFGIESHDAKRFRRIPFSLESQMPGLMRSISCAPFFPAEGPELHRRCAEIFSIQCAGLAKRIERLPEGAPLNIGVSGGLDSTLAILVAVKTCDMLGIDRRAIHGLTMPGFGTTSKTLTNALALMEQLGVSSETIDISTLALDTFRELKHRPFGIDPMGLDLEGFRAALAHVPREKRHDLIFENVQARLRTFLLMSHGFVIGTGDLSELALGWATYNGDHMSMYNPNCSIPKTLVKFLVRYVAEDELPAGPARETLLSIVETVISPELLPFSATGEIEQSTEATLGPYELHDFILYQTIRCGHSPEKIRFLAEHATFSERYELGVLDSTLRTFFTRFFSQQFKRSCVPDGPKVGTVNLSPRGDWRMPSDADPTAWLHPGE